MKKDYLKDAYKAAKEVLIKKYEMAEATKRLHPIIDRNLVSRIYSGTDFSTSPINMERLLWWLGSESDDFVYKKIASKIRIDAPQRLSAEERSIVGGYTYFRYYTETQDCNDINFVFGKIDIIPDGGVLRFKHNSSQYIKSHSDYATNPEHSGYVFSRGDYLFFLGFRKNVIRLSICDKITEEQDYMLGLVLSVRSEVPHDPFAARFVMVSNDNNQLIKRLSDNSPCTPDPSNLAANTNGKKEFFNLTNGGYAFFMLSMHKEHKNKASNPTA